MPSINVLSIDAWRQAEGGWIWNAWYRVGEADSSVCDLSHRRLLSFARKEGYITPASVGRCAVEDDQYNIVIVDRHTREPLIAFEYGPTM